MEFHAHLSEGMNTKVSVIFMGKYLRFFASRYPDAHPGSRVLLLDLENIPHLVQTGRRFILSFCCPSFLLLPPSFPLLLSFSPPPFRNLKHRSWYEIQKWLPPLQLMLPWVLQTNRFLIAFPQPKDLGPPKNPWAQKWLRLKSSELWETSLILKQGTQFSGQPRGTKSLWTTQWEKKALGSWRNQLCCQSVYCTLLKEQAANSDRRCPHMENTQAWLHRWVTLPRLTQKIWDASAKGHTGKHGRVAREGLSYSYSSTLNLSSYKPSCTVAPALATGHATKDSPSKWTFQLPPKFTMQVFIWRLAIWEHLTKLHCGFWGAIP